MFLGFMAARVRACRRATGNLPLGGFVAPNHTYVFDKDDSQTSMLESHHKFETYRLFPNDVRTAFRTHPHFVNAPSVNIDPIPNPICNFLRAFLLWVGNSQLTVGDKMRC
jgi:hypothetical protein